MLELMQNFYPKIHLEITCKLVFNLNGLTIFKYISFLVFFQLEDQAGNSVQIPVKEKKALMVAMTLHEKGRTALKEENYPLALVFLLEADKYFRYAVQSLISCIHVQEYINYFIYL